MAMQYEDFAPQLAKAREKHKEFEVLQHRQREQVGRVLSELQADPRWAMYGDHLAAIKERWAAQLKRAEDMLLSSSYLPPEKYAQLKMEQATAKATVDALTLALTLAKVLIEQGEESARALAKDANFS